MKTKKFNGNVTYEPSYSCEEEDYEAAKALFEDMGQKVSHISPLIDMQIGEEQAVLIQVSTQERGMGFSEPNEQMLLLIGVGGIKYYHVPQKELPQSLSEFEETFLTTEVSERKARSNLWAEVSRLVGNRDEIADYTIESDPIIEIVDEQLAGEGEIELDIEYDDRLVGMVARYYNIDKEEVTEQIISDFITVALYKETQKNV